MFRDVVVEDVDSDDSAAGIIAGPAIIPAAESSECRLYVTYCMYFRLHVYYYYDDDDDNNTSNATLEYLE